MGNNTNKVTGIPENETFWQKAKRKATTAVNWGKTHWKGIALGAVAIGGGAYMLSRRGSNDDGDIRSVDLTREGGEADFHDAINRCFGSETGDGSDIGPDDDEPEVDEY